MARSPDPGNHLHTFQREIAMFLCHSNSCHGCCHSLGRREFLKGCGVTAAATAGSLLTGPGKASGPNSTEKVRVTTVFLSNINIREIWPYPGFDTQGRQAQVMAALQEGCPEIEFIPVTVQQPADIQQAVTMKDETDGFLVYAMTLDWSQRRSLVQLAQLGKPTLVADDYLGGSGVFLTGFSELCSRNIPAALVSSTRLEDLVTVARQFAKVREPGTTPASFARECERVYRQTFPQSKEISCSEDAVALNDVGRCVEQLRRSKFLIVGRGNPGQEQDFLGSKGRYIDFDELSTLCQQVDNDEATEWANRWSQEAQSLASGAYIEPSQPSREAIVAAGGVYLAMLQLLKKYGTDTLTMNCLGGFAAGKLPAYPCLGFMQILNDGGQGVCEAMPDDTLSMLMARLLTGRPGFVSDPAIDTSKNQIVYAHCVGTTKVFGPTQAANEFRIRTLHNRDPRGACSESLMPAGYMTTSFRTNVGRKQMVIHRAKSVGTLDSERGCRTKLLAEVDGDISKLCSQWDRFGWHRVTVFGDVQEPLTEFGKALGLTVVQEA